MRLSDRSQSAGKDNLTIQRLPTLVEAPLRAEVERLLEECLSKCAFARDWRNRRIAHSDLALALEHASACPLEAASRKTVKDALGAIAALLNAVEKRYKGSIVTYELHPLGNAVSLLYVLRDGLKAEADRVKRLKSGNFSPYDFGPGPAI